MGCRFPNSPDRQEVAHTLLGARASKPTRDYSPSRRYTTTSPPAHRDAVVVDQVRLEAIRGRKRFNSGSSAEAACVELQYAIVVAVHLYSCSAPVCGIVERQIVHFHTARQLCVESSGDPSDKRPGFHGDSNGQLRRWSYYRWIARGHGDGRTRVGWCQRPIFLPNDSCVRRTSQPLRLPLDVSQRWHRLCRPRAYDCRR